MIYPRVGTLDRSGVARFSNRTMLLAGIPRSGTSLFTTIMNAFENCCVINESFYDFNTLAGDLYDVRRAIWEGKPIPNKYNKKGKLVTDTYEVPGGAISTSKIYDGQFDENILIGSKVNAPYIFMLNILLHAGFDIIAIVRDPRFVLGSWHLEKNKTLNAANIPDDPRYKDYAYKYKTQIENQAEIWEYMAGIIWAMRDKLTIWRYEDLMLNPFGFCHFIGDRYKLKLNESKMPEIIDRNDVKRYPNMDEITNAVNLICKTRKAFGYGEAEDKIPTVD